MKAIAYSLCCLILAGCIGKKIHTAIQDDGVQIPPDLGLAHDTLLAVLHDTKGYDDILADRMSKYYHGPYKLVTNADLSGPYADVETYRYVFDGERVLDPSGYSPSDMSYQFYVWDRKIKKQYRAAFSTSAYALLMEVYLQKLEAKRQSRATP
jgi:hypothetical protein